MLSANVQNVKSETSHDSFEFREFEFVPLLDSAG
jgi:hypothetical protein